jgi:D-alanyl-D-alanine dipeptidase
MRLSKNFTVSEFIKSQTASRKGIDNSMPEEHLESAQALAENVLQKIRDEFGVVTVTSGYRSEALNEAIGGSSKSQHSKGEAADIEIMGKSNGELADWICMNLDFDQCILEFHTKGDPNSGWVHVSHTTRRKNRKQALTATRRSDGKTKYDAGINY